MGPLRGHRHARGRRVRLLGGPVLGAGLLDGGAATVTGRTVAEEAALAAEAAGQEVVSTVEAR